MKVYISGKIGEEVLSDATLRKFDRAETLLRGQGHQVFNPTRSGLGEHAEYRSVVRGTSFYTEIVLLDLKALSKCDAIYLLPDWKDSPGAKVELEFARAIGLKILEER